jgi:hypothetical protein
MKRIFSTLCLFIAVAVTTVSCSNDDNNEATSSLASINDFKIAIAAVDAASITYDLGTAITVSVPYGTDLTAVVPTVVVSEKATLSPASGTTVSFVDGEAKNFTVTAEDGTTKVYTVTINVRPEVGSGSRLKTYVFKEQWDGGEPTIYTTTYTEYNSANFVSEFTEDENGVTDTYTLVYNDDNEVIEKKSETAKESTVYTYNTARQITKAEYKKNNVLTDTYVYTYNEAGNLTSEVRTQNTDNDKVTTVKFKIVDGNVTEEQIGTEVYVATYDSKNNPFKGIYPAAYAAINMGIQKVSTNNPVTGTFADPDTEVAYQYNTDNYPISASYTYYFGLVAGSKTYTYYDVK